METVSLLCPIGETVCPQVFQGALAAVGYASRNDVAVEFVGVTERTLLDTARNLLVKELLKTKSEWSFWMDSDIILPKEIIVMLLEPAKKKNVKMVSGVYYQRGGRYMPACWVRDPKLESGKPVKYGNQEEYETNPHLGLFAIPGREAKDPFLLNTAGMGCCLIHRNVFESVEYPWYKFEFKKCSEDFYFFVKAKEKGFELWADPRPILGHVGYAKIVTREDCYAEVEAKKVGLEAIKPQADEKTPKDVVGGIEG